MTDLVNPARMDALFEERCLVCNVHCPRNDARKRECRILFKDGGRAFEAELGVEEVIQVGPECEPEDGPLCPFVEATICSRVHCEGGGSEGSAILVRAKP